ncbi:hypothetical protein Y032_0012g1863 [Ancylostoma ceylanicum]|uniref:GIY-YIG domain-containing protein n=1 Tax=Ancylostoma ceylanicum TaxID=53326 RepID=A0A016VD90_9BILA|nr:hypothetical protein Y032_0012g1863 [Ancylostoma ceylanicum]
MFKTAVQLCTGDDEVKESRKLASDIADANGYTVFQRHSRSHTVSSDISRQNKVPLCLPFISDNISAAVRRCIVQAQLQDDVRLVNIPNKNIRSQLVRNRLYDRQCISESCIVCPYGRTGDCAQTGVIYQLQCLTCSETYIGETGRTLGVRIKEHLADKYATIIIHVYTWRHSFIQVFGSIIVRLLRTLGGAVGELSFGSVRLLLSVLGTKSRF